VIMTIIMIATNTEWATRFHWSTDLVTQSNNIRIGNSGKL
jgi:hypothetical protein